MGTCELCHKESSLVSIELGLCLDCIRSNPEKAIDISIGVHARIRREWGLPGEVPKDPEGIICDLCVNQCRIGYEKLGYCGLRKNVKNRMEGVSVNEGKLSWYYDSLPTNCVGDWVGPGGNGCGYPTYS